ncbi:hypothetical protein N7456_003544 [Penicillium angulare]|uniref:Uncharacterized protein n=1 Tax=Penicillium angulare TaxID=116970 RepID=A0A9W9FUX2_9EURO|nr:hypothetical protein N7456_003544 [Penicillium angulare]
MDSQKYSRSSAPLKRPTCTIFDFQSDTKANAEDGSPSKLQRIYPDEVSSLTLKEQQHCSDQLASAPFDTRATSVTTSVATELANSMERAPTDEDAENRCPIDFSIGDVLRRETATRRLHISSNSTVDPYIKLRWKNYPKEQIMISKEFINDIMNTLGQISDYLGADHHVSETSRPSLRLAAEIMQHRCEDIIAGVQPSNNLGQGSTLNPNQWQERYMCTAEEDRLYD